METARKRIIDFIEKQGVKPSDFLKKTGLKKGFIDRSHQDSGATDIYLSKILDVYPNINPAWLLTGRGEMLIQDMVLDQYEELYNGIPLVNVSAVGGFGNDQFSIGEADIKEYYVIPKFRNKKIDFMIEVEGSSMFPKYTSGDIVACRIINESSFIQWNKTHVIATKDQGILIKRIKPGKTDDSVIMVSDNKDYDPFTVRLDDISGIAIVVGTIRLE